MRYLCTKSSIRDEPDGVAPEVLEPLKSLLLKGCLYYGQPLIYYRCYEDWPNRRLDLIG